LTNGPQRSRALPLACSLIGRCQGPEIISSIVALEPLRGECLPSRDDNESDMCWVRHCLISFCRSLLSSGISKVHHWLQSDTISRGSAPCLPPMNFSRSLGFPKAVFSQEGFVSSKVSESHRLVMDHGKCLALECSHQDRSKRRPSQERWLVTKHSLNSRPTSVLVTNRPRRPMP
jgi:hypothetical protein